MKHIVTFVFAAFLSLIGFVSAARAACTDVTPGGTIGSTSNSGPTGYITDIVANGTSVLSVTFTANGTGTKTTNNISFGNNSGITVTGSWHSLSSSRITSLNGVDNGDGTSTISINTTPALRVVGAKVTGSRTWNGVNGGVSKIEGLGGLASGFNVYGWDGGTNTVQQMGLTVVGTCAVTATATVVGNTISMTATAAEATSVDFYLGNPGTKFATATAVPFSGATGALAGGKYTVYAVAHFAAGDVKSSLISNVTIP